MYAKKEKLYPAYVSKYNSNHEKQVIILTIPNLEGWYYLVIKILSTLLRVVTSNHYVDFYCLKFLHSFATKKQNWIT